MQALILKVHETEEAKGITQYIDMEKTAILFLYYFKRQQLGLTLRHFKTIGEI